jgi:hypothetical protein
MWFVGNTSTGFVVKSPRGLTIEGIQYPRNIFSLWSKAQLGAIGIKPYREVAIDTRYYNAGAVVRVASSDEVVGTPASTDKDVATLKEAMTASVGAQVASKQGHALAKAVRQCQKACRHMLIQCTQLWTLKKLR